LLNVVALAVAVHFFALMRAERSRAAAPTIGKSSHLLDPALFLSDNIVAKTRKLI
jgi:hypothetical protein